MQCFAQKYYHRKQKLYSRKYEIFVSIITGTCLMINFSAESETVHYEIIKEKRENV